MAKYIKIDNLDVSDYITVWECNCSEYGKQTVMAVDDLQYLPTADVVEVVRCKDCRFRNTNNCEFTSADQYGDVVGCTEDNDFCSYGERDEK